MTTLTSRHRRLASLAGLGAAIIGSCLLPPNARAAGFSGSFDPLNWSIVNTTEGTVDQTLTSLGGAPPASLTAAAYYCGNGNDVACAESIDAVSGGVDVVGSVSGFDGGGTANTVRTTTWTVTNGPQAVLLSFEWAINIANPSNLSFSYLIGSNETPLGSLIPNNFSPLGGIALAANETFGFRVATSDNIGDAGVLSIANFTATITPASVPGPLPIAGAAAAFGWSRRLRRRIRQNNS